MPILEIDGVGRVEVGDEFLKLSPEQQDATVQEIVSSQSPQRGTVTVRPFKAPEQPQMGVAEDMLRSADAGLARGVGALIGLPGTVGEFFANRIDEGVNLAAPYVEKLTGQKIDTTRPQRAPGAFKLPTIEDIHAEMEANKPLHKPQTVPGEYARTIGEFLPGAVAAPGGVVANALKFGVAPAVASETAGQVTKGTVAEPFARVGGALAGGGAAALLTRPNRTSRVIRQQMPEGVTPQMVDQAEMLIVDAAQEGIALSWPEALSQVAGRPVLTNTMRHLEAAPSSEARMAEFFGPRAQQVEASAGRQFYAVTPAAPNPSTIGPAVGTAAEGAINDVRGAINNATDPLYRAAEGIRLTPQEMARVRALPGYREARDAVRNNPQLNRYVAHLPDNSWGFLNEVKKQLDASAQGARSPLVQNPNMQIPAGYTADAASVRQTLVDVSRRTPGNPGEIALETQAQARERFLQPLLDGPLGKIADKDIATKKAIDVLFPRDPLPNSAEEVATAVRAVAQRNPYAARSLVRAHAKMTFNNAAKDLQSGANQAGGAKFRAVLVGNPQQRANLEAAVRALPNGDQIWPGFNRWLEVLEATGTRQNIGSKTAYNAEFLKERGTSGLIAETGKAVANPLQGVKFLADRYERWQLGQNLDQLAAVLTDPRAGNMFRAIARMPVNSGAARNAALRIAELSESATLPRREPVKQPRK